MAGKCCVYAISDGTGNVKIGVARHPDARRRDLQIGNAYGLQVLFYSWHGSRSEALRSEDRIHERLKSSAVLGGSEWFRVSWRDAFHVFSQECCEVVISTEEPDHIWWAVPSMEDGYGR